jgi:hypothetical protein
LDAILEEFNKDIKGWIGGIPEKKKWQLAVRMHSNLEAMRKMAFKNIGLEEPSTQPRNRPDNGDQVTKWRPHLRRYFNKSVEKPIQSMSSIELCEELVNFTQDAKIIWTDLVNGEKGNKRVFVTKIEKVESEKDKNKTIEALREEIQNLQNQLPQGEREKQLWKSNTRKDDLIKILEKLRKNIAKRLLETSAEDDTVELETK